MPVQTTYKENMDAGRAGDIVNTEHHNLISRSIEDAAGLGFGVAVSRGSQDNTCKLRAAGEAILGVSVREHSLDANTPNSWPQHEAARIMTVGVIWVDVPVAVNAGDQVYVVDADGTFHNAIDENRTVWAGAEFDSSTAGPGQVKIRIK